MHKISSNILGNFLDIGHYVTTKPIALRCPRYSGENKNISEKYKRDIQAKIGTEYLVIANQKHSNTCHEVTRENIFQNFVGDALYTREKNIALFVLASDCVPILFYNAKIGIIGTINAGWKGLQNEIIKNTFSEITQKYNAKIQDFSVFIGSHICQSCYEVGEEVADNFRENYSKYISENSEETGKYFLDIGAIVKQQLSDLGIPKSQIEYSDLCTYEEKEIFHSYRRKIHTGEENYGNNGFGIWLK